MAFVAPVTGVYVVDYTVKAIGPLCSFYAFAYNKDQSVQYDIVPRYRQVSGTVHDHTDLFLPAGNYNLHVGRENETEGSWTLVIRAPS